jgi:dihydrofolate reductase
MSKLRRKLRLNITMSLDGYVAGPDQNEENPLGSGGLDLHKWFFPLKAFREMHGEEGGDVNASSAVVEQRLANIGATIMGRNMFGPVRGPWMDESWRGWWGEQIRALDAPGITHIKYGVGPV